MIKQCGIDKIIPCECLTEDEQNHISLFFLHHGRDSILKLGESAYYTYFLYRNARDYQDIRVKYEPDMFVNSYKTIIEAGYAIAVDEEGHCRAVLYDGSDTYFHQYAYSGGADMWFLDQYECIVLHDCNEHSVELCRSALKLWKGSRLVLEGDNWEGLLPMLPDLPCECWWEPGMTEERIDVLTRDWKTLHIVDGTPHEEKIDRYLAGTLYYAEVMSFTFLFSDYQEWGDLHPDKNFCVLDGGYDNLGLFAAFDKAVDVARYVKSRGFIPIMRYRMLGQSFYLNGNGDDFWAKFFEQPEGYTLEEVLQSKHVTFAPLFYNGSVQSYIMRQTAGEDVQLSWPNGQYNAAVKTYVAERMERYLPNPEHTLGVLARGTDYVNTKIVNHNIHASKEMLCEKIDEMMAADPVLQHIYLSTEDLSYSEFFKERYGEKISFTDQERYTVRDGEMLAQMHEREAHKRDGFLLGAEYIASIALLSRCRSLLASGHCAGTGEALRQNAGKYHEKFIFELGVNP